MSQPPEMFSLKGRTAVITGAASGIGAATAAAFAAAGANLALAWYPPDGHSIEPVVAAVRSHGSVPLAVEVDVRQAGDVARLVQQASATFGTVDIVIGNAGIARIEPEPELVDISEWNNVLDVNLTGIWRCFRQAIPLMRRQGYGRLLATASVSGTVQAWPRHTSYVASKAGIVAMTETLAVALGPYGITVNAVAPGVVSSPQSLDEINSLGEEGVLAEAAAIPVRRVGTGDDIAAALLFLASSEAGYVNGHVLVADGGRHLSVT
jgi:3-oxoacyl-[acyl-carrier protein] reductase